MPRIVLARHLSHDQVEFPPDTPCPPGRRGGRGSSLHLQRGKPRDVSVEELAYIRTHRPELAACLDVLPDPKVPGRTARRLQAAQEAEKRSASPLTPPAPSKSQEGEQEGRGRGPRKRAKPDDAK